MRKILPKRLYVGECMGLRVRASPAHMLSQKLFFSSGKNTIIYTNKASNTSISSAKL